MKNDYTFIEQEKDKAAMLCTQWHIGDNAKIIDDWIDLYLQGMKEGARFINTRFAGCSSSGDFAYKDFQIRSFSPSIPLHVFVESEDSNTRKQRMRNIRCDWVFSILHYCTFLEEYFS